jgi:hypothetical protein
MGRPMPAGSEVRHTLDEVRFEKVDGTWLPMSCRQQFRELFPARSPEPMVWTSYHRKLSVQLNPDFEALKAFRPDDVREDAKVYLFGEAHPVRPDYVWRNGKLQPFDH